MVVLNACESSTTFPRQTSEVNTTNPTQTYTPVVVSTAIQATATPEPEINSQPPICTFPLKQTVNTESFPDSYAFDEPKVVFTNELQPDIVDWLPDSQNAIIMSTNYIDSGVNGYQQTIELLNPQTQETQIYAIRREDEKIPAWNPELKAIVYPDTKIVGTDTKDIQFSSQLRVSYGNPDTTQLLADDLLAHSITVKPDGSQIVYYKNDKELVNKFFSRMVFDGSLQAEKLLPVNLAENELYPFNIYDIVWRLGTSQMFFYSNVTSTDQTILFDVNNGQSCTISFNGWVYFARWSPNGRYLAVIKSPSSHHANWAEYNLSVLDGLTGNLYEVDSTKVGPVEMKNCCRHMIGDISWAPDNRHLIVTGTAGLTGTTTYVPINKLYLVDFLSGDVNALFPSYEFNAFFRGTGLAWSPDGFKVLMKCPTEKQGGLCLIAVKRTAEP